MASAGTYSTQEPLDRKPQYVEGISRDRTRRHAAYLKDEELRQRMTILTNPRNNDFMIPT